MVALLALAHQCAFAGKHLGGEAEVHVRDLFVVDGDAALLDGLARLAVGLAQAGAGKQRHEAVFFRQFRRRERGGGHAAAQRAAAKEGLGRVAGLDGLFLAVDATTF